MFEIVETSQQDAVIKVIGVGGGGGNAVEHMVRLGIPGVDFICANTDAQALKSLSARTLMQLGQGTTKGLGAGADPAIGRAAALEDRERIAESLAGADMVFITAGMGGGTGTGGAPVVAEVLQELGILTVAVVTKPFELEGRKRMRQAEEGIGALAEQVNSLITIPNEKLMSVLGESTSLVDGLAAADNVLAGAVQGIADLFIRPGRINLDFADVKTVMSEMGRAMIGSGQASGDSRAKEAADSALGSPLLEDFDFTGAKGVLVNICASDTLTLGEVRQVGAAVEGFADENATVVLGTVLDDAMGEELRVTLVATGMGGLQREAARGLAPVAEFRRALVGNGPPDYAQFDQPTVLRHQQAEGASPPAPANVEYLDVPAFLRRQAD